MESAPQDMSLGQRMCHGPSFQAWDGACMQRGHYARKGKNGRKPASPYSSVTNSGDAASAYQRMPRAPPVMCTCSAEAVTLLRSLKSAGPRAGPGGSCLLPVPHGRLSHVSGVSGQPNNRILPGMPCGQAWVHAACKHSRKGTAVDATAETS